MARKRHKRYAVLLCKPACITVIINADSEEEAKENALVNNSEYKYERLWVHDLKYSDSVDAHVSDIQEVKT